MLVEVLVALALFSLIAVVVSGLAVDALWTVETGSDLSAATAFAQEGIEASRQITDRSWAVLAVGDHGVTTETVGNETRYAFAASSDTFNGFSRVVRVTEVQRDANGAIVASGGTIDPDTRRVDSVVTWRTGVTRRAQSVTLATLLSHWEGASWVETLRAQFRQGTLASTGVVAAPEPPTDNGSVRLAGAVDWTAPVIRGTVDVPGNGDGTAVVVRTGYAYLVTDDGGDGRLVIVDVSDVTTPQITGSVSVGAPAHGLVVLGGYAYVARKSGSGELAVVDVRTPTAPILVRTIDVAGSAGGQSLAAEGQVLVLGRLGSAAASEVVTFTIPSSDPSSPATRGSLDLAGDPTVLALAVRTATAVLGTGSDSAELQTVDLGAVAAPLLRGTLDLAGNADVTGVAVTGNRAYLTRDGGSELAVADLATLTSPALLGELDLGNGANSLAAEGGFAYVAARAQGSEFQRVDVGTPAQLSVAGTAAVGAEPRGAVFSGNYAYLATAGNDRELVIVGGGEGGWANPVALGSVNLAGIKDLLAVAVTGDYALVGRQKTEGSGEVLILSVQEPRAPSLVGQLEINDAVNDVAAAGHRAYLATDRDVKEFVAVDVANPASPVELGSYNAPSNADGRGVFVSGTLAVLSTRANGSGPEVYLLDVSDPAAPALRGSIDAGGSPDVNAVTGTSTTIYLATSDAARDVQAYDVTDPASPAILGSFDTPGSGNALTLTLRGTELYVGTRNNASGSDPEFFILDVSNPAAPRLVSTGSALDIGGDVFGLDVAGTVGFVGTNRDDREFQTLNLAVLASPSLRGTKEIDASVNDLTVAGTYAYLATAEDDAEFQIVKSSDAEGFAPAGSYTSIPFDSASDATVWESLDWSAALNGGTLRFQLRRGATQTALESAQFVGPDGTANTFHGTPGVLTLPNSLDPLPGRWLQWQTTFQGSQTATPELQDVTLTFRR